MCRIQCTDILLGIDVSYQTLPRSVGIAGWYTPELHIVDLCSLLQLISHVILKVATKLTALIVHNQNFLGRPFTAKVLRYLVHAVQYITG